ncbi:MAG TPA: glycosyl hydrolase [Pyrinomonadaceae bacterium]|nr:glycosyl hydrolase [Pyrinomonadaceae bacterium]
MLASLRIPKDVEYSRALDAKVSWLHRRAPDTDIYFFANRTDRPQDINARFRVSGKEAELWHADTGEIEPAEFRIDGGHDEGVKYFSGTATYTTTMKVDRRWFRQGAGSRARILLNPGAVNDLAEVSVNGQVLGILWKWPYQVDVTGALKPGANQLEIKVTNQWTNRLIGDRSALLDRKVLAAGVPGFGPPPTLSDSGLLGPVTLVTVLAPAVRNRAP